jgi:hypothetical protein
MFEAATSAKQQGLGTSPEPSSSLEPGPHAGLTTQGGLGHGGGPGGPPGFGHGGGPLGGLAATAWSTVTNNKTESVLTSVRISTSFSWVVRGWL